MPPAGFEPAITGSQWPETNALDRATTRMVPFYRQFHKFTFHFQFLD
jgi:hypothetical protein